MAELNFKLTDDFEHRIEKTVDNAVNKALEKRLSKEESKDRRLTTRIKLAKLLHVSLPTLDRYSDKGIFRRIVIDGKILFDLDEVDAVLNK